MTGDDIRSRFMAFFEAHDHLLLPSAKLLPDDPTTYFTTAGMQPFVPYFLGNERPPARRVASCQKCLRADDLDEVGYTARHLSLFEMLGNFSFFDYFKRDAIAWGWEFMRQGLGFDPERLWVSVYENDDEAASLWEHHVGVPAERIVRFGMKENWWGPVGSSGPCGPCSEIFLDRGPDWGDAHTPLEDEGGDRYVELWNLVFQQYNSAMSKAELMRTGTVPPPLPAPGIDTGAGLERIAAATQGVSTVFESDLLRPLCEAVVEVARAHGAAVTYGGDREVTAAINRVSDHVRALTFAISDGVFPSNKAGGYVLRQILRRAARFGRLRLGLDEPFVYKLVPAVVARYETVYPEVREGQATAETIIRQEEERFAEALETGLPRLDEALAELKQSGGTTLPGKTAFFLYETFGLPVEMQAEVAAEQGLAVAEEEFEAIRTSRESVHIVSGFTGHGDFGDDLLGELPPTRFTGYDEEECHAEVLAILAGAELDGARGLVTRGEQRQAAETGETLTLVLDRSPFYAESGGQTGDHGSLVIVVEEAEVVVVDIADVQKDKNGHWLHQGTVSVGRLELGERVNATVDSDRRDRIRRAHTATHLLHAALRGRLGRHVAQAGSLVEPDRLRFDFSHFAALTDEDLRAVEDAGNGMVLANHPMLIAEMPIEEARELGALMFFGEKYGKTVRVVNVGEEYAEVSTELCGGTHVRRTGDIGQVRVLGESSVGSGVRRIEALTGQAALEYGRGHTALLREAAARLRVPADEVFRGIERQQERIRELQAELRAARQARAAVADLLKQAADDLCGAGAEPRAALLGAVIDGKVVLVCKANDAAVAMGAHAGNTVKAAAAAAGGRGGGKPQFAQGGGPEAGQVEAAVAAGLAALRAQLGG
ncbi:MAG: alanine--tRNA ligase [Armatimonadetes bacterium]|nr:alanine--tRNA ligase [Armatimonadota bacterium]